jgi:capsular polysaccharide biosynthesis protein
VEADRYVRNQAAFLTSPPVLERAVRLVKGRVTVKQLRKRLVAEPSKESDLVTVRVRDASAQGAVDLAAAVGQAYEQTAVEQDRSGVARTVAQLQAQQKQLQDRLDQLNAQLQAAPSEATRTARDVVADELAQVTRRIEETKLADTARDPVALREQAVLPEQPAQPQPLRMAAIGALLALVVGAGLAWWLNGRAAQRRRLEPVGAPAGQGEQPTGLEVSSSPLRLGAHLGNGHVDTNGAPASNGSASGIADFDQISTSVQELFRFMDGPSQRLYEEDLPQLAVEEIAHRFQVDMAAILLDNAGEIQTMGSVGLRATRHGTIDRGVRHLIDSAVRSGPRLVDVDELVRLSSMGLGGDQADSLALVPLVRDHVAFGMLLAGRRHTDERVTPLSNREVQDIADCTRDILPYIWAWLLLRNLKLRLRTLQ